MKNITLSLLTLLMLSTLASFAQIGNIKFDKTTHDFGRIREEIKTANYEFVFTNTGDADLKILKVKTSCGCTASDYSRSPIQPGKTGTIKISYSTTGRPASFRKSITVTINNPDNPNTVLYIKGFVIPKEEGVESSYPTAIGNLKLTSNHLAFNEMLNNETSTDSIKIYNKWEFPMDISFEQVPQNITISCTKPVIESKGEAIIIVTYDASKKQDFGLVYDRIAIRTNDKTQPMKILNISARIKQDFSTMSPRELKKAPKIVFVETSHDFGTVTPGTTVKYSFNFKNEGKNNLKILKVKASCGCTTTNLSKREFKKNEEGTIEAVFNTRGRKGSQHKTITITTNDPQNPQITITLRGDLK